VLHGSATTPLPSVRDDASVAVVCMTLKARETDPLSRSDHFFNQLLESVYDIVGFIDVRGVSLKARVVRRSGPAKALRVARKPGMDVLDPNIGERTRESRLREAWLMAPGSLAHIDKHRDLLLTQDLDELVDRSLLVPECEYRRHRLP
jgi:hypothetical protein